MSNSISGCVWVSCEDAAANDVRVDKVLELAICHLNRTGKILQVHMDLYWIGVAMTSAEWACNNLGVGWDSGCVMAFLLFLEVEYPMPSLHWSDFLAKFFIFSRLSFLGA